MGNVLDFTDPDYLMTTIIGIQERLSALENKGTQPTANNTQQLKAEIAAIAKRCEIAPKSHRHHLILDTDLERLLQLSAI